MKHNHRDYLMKHKQWVITQDWETGMYWAEHENYDPTPVHPFDPMSDVDHILCGVSVEDCIKQINEMEMAA